MFISQRLHDLPSRDGETVSSGQPRNCPLKEEALSYQPVGFSETEMAVGRDV
jgi:hypothetical protein